ncbi:AAA family ATPase, partial [Solirubrobacter deserti]
MARLHVPTVAPGLIERHLELDALRSAVRGGGGIVVFEAPAGLGKTTLLEQGAAMAGAAGWLVRRAAPSPLERELPYGVLRALLETPARERLEAATGAAAVAGELLLQGVSPRDASGVLPLAHSVLWLCSGLGPLALVIDDAQWADRESLAVLAYLARRVEDLPLLILVGTRGSCDLLSLVGGVRAAAVRALEPLSAAGAARLVRRHLADAPGTLCRDLHRASGGVPWLLTELASGDGVSRAPVRRRLAELSARDRGVAEAAAVVGDTASPHVLARVAGVGGRELAHAFGAPAAAALAVKNRFGPPLVSRSIASDLPRATRERLHRAAARALTEAGAGARTVAAHLLECAPAADPDVTRGLMAAAHEARTGTPRGVAGVGRAGDGGTPGVAGVAWAGDASTSAPAAGAELSGGVAGADEAVMYLRRALDEGASGDDRGALLAALGTAAFDAGLPEARGWLLAAADECGVRTVDVVGRLAAFGVVAGDCDAVLDAFIDEREEHARQLARRSGTDVVLLAHRAWAALGRRDPAAVRLALMALADPRLLAEADRRRAYELCARVLVVCEHDAAEPAITALRAAATTVGMRAAATSLAAEHALRRGRLIEAERLARTALAFPEPFRGGALALLVHALAERGAVCEAHAVLRAGAREATEWRGAAAAARGAEWGGTATAGG